MQQNPDYEAVLTLDPSCEAAQVYAELAASVDVGDAGDPLGDPLGGDPLGADPLS